MGCTFISTQEDLDQMRNSMRNLSSQANSFSFAGPNQNNSFNNMDPNNIVELEEFNPMTFGTFAHVAYQVGTDYRFDDVAHEVPITVEKGDGSKRQGRVDDIIDGRVLIDYKTNDMRDWDRGKAATEAAKHGEQMREYMTSEDTPNNATGFIVSSVPPSSNEAKSAYEEKLGDFGVGVKWSSGEDTGSVLDAVNDAVEDSNE